MAVTAASSDGLRVATSAEKKTSARSRFTVDSRAERVKLGARCIVGLCRS